jgi:hypothetical protein
MRKAANEKVDQSDVRVAFFLLKHINPPELIAGRMYYSPVLSGI